MAAIDEHPLVKAADKTFYAAKQGLDVALEYLSATNSDDFRRLRVAYGGVATACDALKAAANASSNMLGVVSRDGCGRG